jgi:hypothetical protein
MQGGSLWSSRPALARNPSPSAGGRRQTRSAVEQRPAAVARRAAIEAEGRAGRGSTNAATAALPRDAAATAALRWRAHATRGDQPAAAVARRAAVDALSAARLRRALPPIRFTALTGRAATTARAVRTSSAGGDDVAAPVSRGTTGNVLIGARQWSAGPSIQRSALPANARTAARLAGWTRPAGCNRAAAAVARRATRQVLVGARQRGASASIGSSALPASTRTAARLTVGANAATAGDLTAAAVTRRTT